MKAILFDTETTGLVKNRTLKLELQPEIIEFYACEANLKTGKIIKELDLLIKPKKALSDKPAFGEKKTITQITGITNEMLADKKPFSAHAKDICKFLKKGPVVIAHNASFDQEMVDIELQRLETELHWPKLICTVEQTISMLGFRLSMTKMHEYLFNEPFTGAHRAKVDVAALLRCCVELHKRGVL